MNKKIPELGNITEIKQDLLRLREIYKDNIVEVGELLENQLLNGSNVLFEGAQATLLDIDHGLYPYGTSSTCIASGGSSGTGGGVQYLNERIGVVKAYVSRVGAGPLMGELDTSVNPGKTLQIEGGEFGTTPGRPRRIAWLDLVAVKYTCRVNGLTGIAMTKLDILGILDKLQVICEYEDNEQKINSTFPARIDDFKRLQPVTKNFSGWGKLSREEWLGLMEKGWAVFPKELKDFINFIEEEINIPVVILGLGPERKLTFEKHELKM